MIRVKVMLTLDVDEDEYPIPADENVAEEIETSITEFIYDIGGVKIKNMRTIQENKND
jgi:hypothetical protein|tara:strand:- start:167 stop:340 length:174 start_codon:yes stop_codon:yes gene_type:complete